MVVEVLLIAGDHVPPIPSFEEPGSVMLEPLHTGPIGSKVGIICEETVTCDVVVPLQGAVPKL